MSNKWKELYSEYYTYLTTNFIRQAVTMSRNIMKKFMVLSRSYIRFKLKADTLEFHESWENRRVWASIKIQSLFRCNYDRKRYIKLRKFRR